MTQPDVLVPRRRGRQQRARRRQPSAGMTYHDSPDTVLTLLWSRWGKASTQLMMHRPVYAERVSNGYMMYEK